MSFFEILPPPDSRLYACRPRRLLGWSAMGATLGLIVSTVLTGCSSGVSTPSPSAPPLLSPPPAATLPPILTPTATSDGNLLTFAPVPALTDEDWTRGAAGAPVTIVVYSDFQCEPCAQLARTLDRLLVIHPEEVLLVFRPYPLVTNHDKSSLAVQVAESAGAQGSFWEMHDLLFSRQADWLAMTPEAFIEWVVQASAEIGVDAVALREDLEGGRYEERVDGAFSEAVASGIPGVPFLFVNGEDFRIPPSLSVLSASVRLESLRSRQHTSLPPMTIDPGAQYMARLDTSRGSIETQLYAESAPIAVNSFVFLAREGWFDRTYFHHVIPGTLVEGGDPSGTGLGDPGYSFAMELDPLLDFDEPGMVALSAEGPGINSGRFFITLSPQPSLDGSRTIIGRVVKGLAILEELPSRDPLLDLLNEPALTIYSVHIEGP